PRKVGYVYLIRNETGGILLERRPEKAMMGGMSAFPTSSWESGWDNISHPDYLHVTPSRKAPAIRHSFTHFDLELKLYEATLDPHRNPTANYYWVLPAELKEQGFPTLFKKAFKLWHDELIAPPARKAV
ncbi:MAG: NUDIX domain-containing protein, partial [Alphaproteobacteria bacterium]|nr:NUDIX domain-containing protein [Alphaproteobacteria bacterium]